MPKTKSKEPELEFNAKWSGPEFWKDWGKNDKVKKGKHMSKSSDSGGLYFVGFVGALIYNIQAAIGFGAVVTGILKAMIWPAYVVYKLLESFYGVV